MKRFAAVAVVVLGALASVTAAQAGATTTSTNSRTPVSFPVAVPCANGGAGETVDVSGTVHDVFRTTVNGNHFSTTQTENFPDLKGLGEITGDTYVGGGGSQDTFNGSFTNGQMTIESTVNEHLNGQGSAPNITFSGHEHITVNADGTVTVSFNNFEVDCG